MRMHLKYKNKTQKPRCQVLCWLSVTVVSAACQSNLTATQSQGKMRPLSKHDTNTFICQTAQWYLYTLGLCDVRQWFLTLSSSLWLDLWPFNVKITTSDECVYREHFYQTPNFRAISLLSYWPFCVCTALNLTELVQNLAVKSLSLRSDLCSTHSFAILLLGAMSRRLDYRILYVKLVLGRTTTSTVAYTIQYIIIY